jgi:predicted phage terminase large subunit-like protein
MDESLFSKIAEKIKRHPEDYQAYRDLYDLAVYVKQTDIEVYLKYLRLLAAACEKAIFEPEYPQIVSQVFNLHKEVLLALAPYDFDSYIQYIEWDREPRKKFYMPRRKQLRPVVDALQDLEDDKLDLLAISLPPGTGKTTLAMFFLTWLAGKHPDDQLLTGSHSNSFVRGVYDECLRVFQTSGEYLWHDVFPKLAVTSTNAKDSRIDLGARQRFETLEFTSIGTGNAGLYRASRLLYCDDLVSGIEVALSKERLEKLWETYTTDLRQRKIGDHCKELHIATRWSVHDVIGRLEVEYADNPRAKFITVPALNANDESNFKYAYGVGFSTEFYHEQRAIMDDASWRALYMNEPIEREGLVYHEDELRRYWELPSSPPDAILAICDTKDTGKDYCFMPVCYVYGEDHYMADCICDNGLPEVVDIRLAEILLRHKVKACRFESNSAGRRTAEKVQDMVKSRGGITHITSKFTKANKETKILINSDWVKEHVLFKDQSMYTRNSDYGKAMNMLCSYTMMGKNKHDDVPDGIAQYAEFVQSLEGTKVEVFNRPW